MKEVFFTTVCSNAWYDSFIILPTEKFKGKTVKVTIEEK